MFLVVEISGYRDGEMTILMGDFDIIKIIIHEDSFTQGMSLMVHDL